MNLTGRSLLVITYSIAMGLSQTAIASDATAYLDWSKLKISVTGVDGVAPTVTFSDQNTTLNSSASTPNQISESDSTSIYNWTSPANTDVQAGDTYANALVSPLTFSGNVHATGISGDVPWQSVQASSTGSRAESFSFDGPGVLTSIRSIYDQHSGCEPFDFLNSTSASVSGSASFSGGENGNLNSSSSASFSLDSIYGLSPQSQSGNLVFGIFAGGPGTGSLGFNFNLSAQAPVSPVPEPESYAMLLPGLGLMGVMVRRFGLYQNLKRLEGNKKIFYFQWNITAASCRRPFLSFCSVPACRQRKRTACLCCQQSALQRRQ